MSNLFDNISDYVKIHVHNMTTIVDALKTMQQIIDIQNKYMKNITMNEFDSNELKYKLNPKLQQFYLLSK
jgi:hypothetical protein